MTEGEVVERLVEFTSILLAGLSVLFTVVSAYVAGLNYFIGTSRFLGRLCAFAFITLVFALLMVVMMGASNLHAGLIARLVELDGLGQLTAAGRAALANSALGVYEIAGYAVSVDQAVQIAIWGSAGAIYGGLAYMTFIHRWTPDIVPVSIQD